MDRSGLSMPCSFSSGNFCHRFYLFKRVEYIRVELPDRDHVGQILQFDVNTNFTLTETPSPSIQVTP
jgi:hypothetical protein